MAPSVQPSHPRTIGWIGTTALAMGGSNQSIFLLSALLIGQDNIPGQGTAAIPLLFLGLVLGWMAMPGWTELVLMYPNRVGGIGASCAEAFRPYNPVLANLTGVCYWWGWVPCCGLTAILSATAIHDWYTPWMSIPALAIGIVLFFTGISLCGIKWVTRLAIPIATISAGLAFLSVLIPVFSGNVDWHQATHFKLTTPFPGWFGALTSSMAGLYLIGFAAPAFETAACHVGETIDYKKNVPRAMFASAGIATLFFGVIPMIWLGVLGPDALSKDLAVELGPVFAPVFGAGARAAAVWFMIFNMFQGTLSPVASAARALSQMGDDGLMPEIFSARMKHSDAPWFATIFTATISVIFLLLGDPLWLIAAANMTYLIGISLPNVAVWLLRKNAPTAERPYRAPRGMIVAGLLAAGAWIASTILGFQQFGMPTVIAGLAFAYAGAGFYAYRRWRDRLKAGLPGMPRTLHFKLTGAMLLVLVLDATGYLVAVNSVPAEHTALISALQDIFVAVALLTITVGLVLPGVISHSVVEVSKAADNLARGTLADFSRAMKALSDGNLDAAYATVNIVPVQIRSRDEIGEMAASFNTLQNEIAKAAIALDGAREGVRKARGELREINVHLEQRVVERTAEVVRQKEDLQISEARKNAIVQSALDGIVTINHEGKIVEFNPAAEKIFGYSRDAILGKELVEVIIPPLFRQEYLQGLTHYLSTGNSNVLGKRIEVVAMRSNGSEFPIELTVNRLGAQAPPTFTGFVRDLTEHKEAEEKLERMNKQLLIVSRQSGMAEVASSVLHNAGNVLNSVNVSATLVTEQIKHSKLAGLVKIAEFVGQNPSDFHLFIQNDPRGQKLPEYFKMLASYWQQEQALVTNELKNLNDNIQHVKDIIAMQQSLTGVSGIQEPAKISHVIQNALNIVDASFKHNSITVTCDFEELPPSLLEKSKLMQILVNLLQNANDAMDTVPALSRAVSIKTRLNDGNYTITVSDNGMGIRPEDLARIFAFGFTTKTTGHGIGLHISALSAKDMGGSLLATSAGPGKGAQFLLRTPFKAIEVRK